MSHRRLQRAGAAASLVLALVAPRRLRSRAGRRRRARHPARRAPRRRRPIADDAPLARRRPSSARCRPTAAPSSPTPCSPSSATPRSTIPPSVRPACRPTAASSASGRDPAADTTHLTTTITAMNRGPALDMLNELADDEGFTCYTPDGGHPLREDLAERAVPGHRRAHAVLARRHPHRHDVLEPRADRLHRRDRRERLRRPVAPLACTIRRRRPRPAPRRARRTPRDATTVSTLESHSPPRTVCSSMTSPLHAPAAQHAVARSCRRIPDRAAPRRRSSPRPSADGGEASSRSRRRLQPPAARDARTSARGPPRGR